MIDMRPRYYVTMIGALSGTVVTVALIALKILFGPTRLASFHEAGVWAEVSIAAGASALTIVGIITALLTSRENDRRKEFNEDLTLMLVGLEKKASSNPDKSPSKISIDRTI